MRAGLKQDERGQLYQLREIAELGDDEVWFPDGELARVDVTSESPPMRFWLDTSDRSHSWVAVGGRLSIESHCGRDGCGCAEVPLFEETAHVR